MNAKWMAHLIQYRESEHRIGAIQTILHEKITRQSHALERYKKSRLSLVSIGETNIEKLFLIEAQYARKYWRQFAMLLPVWCKWQGRIPHGEDILNKILDVGYHTLAHIIQSKCEKLDIPTEIGILHVAQSRNAHPLVYDLMECFRAMMVDEILLKFLHMKKAPIDKLTQEVIQAFLHDVYGTLHKEYYHKDRKVCVSLSYWIDLVLLEFRNAVSEQRAFNPAWTPVRHEHRCKRKPPHSVEA
jgi:CRISPR-associated endonuclease Cas1